MNLSEYEACLTDMSLEDTIGMMDHLEAREIELESARDERRDSRAIARCWVYLRTTRVAVGVKLDALGLTIDRAREALSL